ncbi:hypothetical protein ACFT4A_14590 [Streptomyces sp. NPDC057099]|uniref:hypothetical protein n=1 Tax=Streptomyces sp. NPDC057099 TaxID=3346019 RepID=UPI0036328F50
MFIDGESRQASDGDWFPTDNPWIAFLLWVCRTRWSPPPVGGLTEPIALGLKNSGHETVFYWYVTGCTALTFLATLFLPEAARLT